MKNNLIVIEGLDKVGKTTLVENLKIHNPNSKTGLGKIKFFNFPSSQFSYLRQLTKQFDSTTAYIRDLAHALSHGLTYLEMEKEFGDEDWVICDRYWYSSLIYSDAEKMLKIENEWMDPKPFLPKFFIYLYTNNETGYPDFAKNRHDEDPNDLLSAEKRKEMDFKYKCLCQELSKENVKVFQICVDGKTSADVLDIFISIIKEYS